MMRSLREIPKARMEREAHVAGACSRGGAARDCGSRWGPRHDRRLPRKARGPLTDPPASKVWIGSRVGSIESTGSWLTAMLVAPAVEGMLHSRASLYPSATERHPRKRAGLASYTLGQYTFRARSAYSIRSQLRSDSQCSIARSMLALRFLALRAKAARVSAVFHNLVVDIGAPHCAA